MKRAFVCSRTRSFQIQFSNSPPSLRFGVASQRSAARILCGPGKAVVHPPSGFGAASHPSPMRGAERRETQGLARPLERLAQPPDTLARRVLPPCDRGKAPLGAPLAAISDPGSALPGPRLFFPWILGAQAPHLKALRPQEGPRRPCPASSSRRGRSAPRRQVYAVCASLTALRVPGPPGAAVTSRDSRRRIPLRLQDVPRRRPSMNGI